MTYTTTKHGLLVPEGTDPAGNGDLVLEQMALDLDTKLDTATSGWLRHTRNIAMYQESNANLPGYVIIQTNLDFGNYMVRLDVKGFTYAAAANIIDLSITFYAFAADQSFYNYEVKNNGTLRFANVQLMRRNSDGKVAVLLQIDGGQASGQWNYPKLTVDAFIGHTITTDEQLKTGWSIFRVTDGFTGYTSIRSVPSTRPYMRAVLSPQVVGTGVWTTLVNWTEAYSHPGLVGIGSGWWTANQAGLYHVDVQAMFRNEVSSAGVRAVQIRTSAGEIAGQYAAPVAAQGDYATAVASVTIPVNSGWSFYVQVLQTSGGNVTVHGNPWTTVTINRVD